MDFVSYISLNQWMYLISIIIYVVIIISCVYVVLTENRNPIKSLAWVTVLIFLPIVGWVFYMFFGRSLKGLHLISRQKKRKSLNSKKNSLDEVEHLEVTDRNQQLIKLSYALCGAAYYRGNDVEIFNDGREKFDRLREDIVNAKRFINIQYYIFCDDAIGHEIAYLLSKKVKEGVEVRVIYDHVGSFSVKNRFFKHLRDAGVDAHPFFRVTFPQFANRINWRNHRKITVIDGEIGYIGGMNVADRYLKGLEPGKIWRDTHLRVTGPIVEAMQYSFSADWSFMQNTTIEDNQPVNPMPTGCNTAMQLIASGPNSAWSNIALIFHKAIAGARKSVYIQTPYFLPTEALLKALLTAALSGVDVRIMIPRKSDSTLLRYASYSYIEECLKAGIKIYLYDAGMLHSKNLIVDEELVSSGSTNFDFRSFEHNFEANLMIYSKDVNAKFRNIFFQDIKNSTKLSLSVWQKRPKTQSLLESIIRLLAPIL